MVQSTRIRRLSGMQRARSLEIATVNIIWHDATIKALAVFKTWRKCWSCWQALGIVAIKVRLRLRRKFACATEYKSFVKREEFYVGI